MLVRSATKGKSRSATTMMLRRLTYSGPPQLGVVPEAVFVIIVLASRTGDEGRSIFRLPSDIILTRISSAMIKPC